MDPLEPPLPAGTEVVTRVDRAAGERMVKQGAVGRVVGTDGDEVDVLVVGVGPVRFLRREITPRKPGQRRFAERRDAAWTALRPCVVLDAIVGSRAWGLHEEASDTDRRGVFALPFAWTAGLAPPPVDLVSVDGSETYWEIEKAIRQALRADPNTLELLFVDTVTVRDEVGAWLLEARDAFVSREIYGTFGRYALSQLRRLEQSARLARHRGAVLDWLRADPSLDLEATARRLAAESSVEVPTGADPVARARDYLKQLYRSLHDQGLLAANEFAALRAFARDGTADFELPRELRPKNAYNLIRLIAGGTAWLETGRPQLRVESPLREELLAIKRGAVTLDEVLRRADALMPALDAARARSPLPEKADASAADRLLRRVRSELARRHVEGVSGVFGAGAPARPLATWEDE